MSPILQVRFRQIQKKYNLSPSKPTDTATSNTANSRKRQGPIAPANDEGDGEAGDYESFETAATNRKRGDGPVASSRKKSKKADQEKDQSAIPLNLHDQPRSLSLDSGGSSSNHTTKIKEEHPKKEYHPASTKKGINLNNARSELANHGDRMSSRFDRMLQPNNTQAGGPQLLDRSPQEWLAMQQPRNYWHKKELVEFDGEAEALDKSNNELEYQQYLGELYAAPSAPANADQDDKDIVGDTPIKQE